MVKTIEISDELYNRLGSLAQGFGDSPASVIERLANNQPDETRGIYSPPATYSTKDTTKYLFNGRRYGKGRLVLAVIAEFVERNPRVIYEELRKEFPKELQGSVEVVEHLYTAKEKTKSVKRHYFQEDEIIYLSNHSNSRRNPVVVSSQWGIGNIDKFIERAEELDFEITRTA